MEMQIQRENVRSVRRSTTSSDMLMSCPDWSKQINNLKQQLKGNQICKLINER